VAALAGCTDRNPSVTIAPANTISDSAWKFETTPTFADEFNTPGSPDPTKWTYDEGYTGWGNNESEYYTRDNCEIPDTVLTITAKKEAKGDAKYTSGRMVTRGLADFTYGRFVARIKLPTGRGLWPAFWMLPTDRVYGDWPKSGEIDILEQVGYDPNTIHISTHCESFYFKLGNQKTAAKVVASATTDFHIYRLDWTPYAVRGYIDQYSTPVFEYTNKSEGYTTWPFNQRFHMLLNVAVGGDWGGANGIDDAIFPKKMEVDYVRYYKLARN